MSNPSCVIIGGGVCGLTAGTVLRDAGWQVTVLDKGHLAGGRMATRQIRRSEKNVGVFDYGAQYFTAKDRRFREIVARWEKHGIVTRWGSGYPTMNDAFLDTGEIRYRGVDSMRAIAAHLAESLVVQTETMVNHLAIGGGTWTVRASSGSEYSADAILLTPPVPQSLALLLDSGIHIPDSVLQRLESVSYTPAIAVLALLEGPSVLTLPGGMWGDGDPIAWICDNNLKGISPSAHAVTVLTSVEFSREYRDRDDADVIEAVRSAANRWLGAPVAEWQVHRWRYSLVERSFGSSFLALPTSVPCHLAGDAFGGGRIEGAVLSGLDAANDLMGSF